MQRNKLGAGVLRASIMVVGLWGSSFKDEGMLKTFLAVTDPCQPIATKVECNLRIFCHWQTDPRGQKVCLAREVVL
jgi:hypothetical protein